MLRLFFFCLPIFVLTACGNRYWYQGDVTYADTAQPLPFEYTFSELYVTVEIDGADYRFIVDTGAPTVIDEQLQVRHQFAVNKNAFVTDSKGVRRKQDYVRIPAFRVGGLTATGTNAIVSDLSGFTCMDIDGILGANVMRAYDWEIDYQSEQFRLHTAKLSRRLAEAYPIALPFNEQSTGTPIVALQLDERKISPLTFDTGSGGALTLRKTAPVDTTRGIRYRGLGSRGLFGRQLDSLHYTRTTRLRIGGTPVDTTLIMYRSSGKQLIGNKLLDNYRVLIRWSTRTIHLQPVEEPSDLLPASTHILLWDNDTIRVGRRAVGAFSLRLPINAVVTEINGTSVLPITAAAYCALRYTPDLVLTVQNADGSPKRVMFTEEQLSLIGIRREPDK